MSALFVLVPSCLPQAKSVCDFYQKKFSWTLHHCYAVCSEIILTSVPISCNEIKLCVTWLKSCMYCPTFVTNIFYSYVKVLYAKFEVHVEMR